MGATEKKVALVISFKTEGGQVIAVNLKNIGDAQEQAAKKSDKHLKALESLGKKIFGLVQIKLAVKAIKEVANAISELSTQSLAYTTHANGLGAAFDSSSSSMKTGFAQITSAALPTLVAFQKSVGASLGKLGDFVDKNRELISTKIAEWAVSAAATFIDLLVPSVQLAITAYGGLKIALAAIPAAGNQAVSSLSSGLAFIEGGLVKAFNAIGTGNAKATAEAIASNQAELERAGKLLGNEADAASAEILKIEKAMREARGSTGKFGQDAVKWLADVLKEAKKLAKTKISISDPEKDAAALSAKEREIARHIELATQAKDKETALGNATLAWFALNEAKKMAIAGESAAAYAARQDAIADKIRAVNQLETDLENKFQAKYIADLAARAQADADYQTKLRGLLESQAEYRADLESKKSTDQREAPKSFLSDMVAAGKANSFVGPKTEDQTAKDKKVLEDYADGVKELARNIGSGIASVMSEAIASVASGSKSALDALGGMLGGIVMMLGQMLIQLGTAALVASALSAIPFFAPLVGGPAAAGAGAAAIIAGGIMVAAGAGLNSAIGMASGGLVLAGSPNFDSVPALLQRGEYVIPAAQVRENVRSGRAPDDSGKAGGGGGGVSISVTQQSFVPGTKADFNRSVRDAVLPAIQQLARQGLLNLRGG